MVVCLEQGASLHMAQLMPLPLTVSCFSKIQFGFTFLVPAHLGSPGKRAVKWVCVKWVSDSWMLQNGGKCLTIYDVAARLGCALPQAMTPVNIQSGFLVAGIWPFDRHVFSDDDVGCGWKLSSTGDITVEHLLPHTLVDILADKEATWTKNASLRR